MIHQLFRRMLRLYPESFRRRFGRELLQMWRLELDEANTLGRMRRLGLGVRLVAGVVVDALRLRLRPDPGVKVAPSGPRAWADLLGWEALRMDLRFAWRSFCRRPGWTATAVGTLALGLGATTAVCSIVQDTLLRPPPYLHPDELMVVQALELESGRPVTASFPAFEEYRRSPPGLESLEGWVTRPQTVAIGEAAGRRRVALMSSGVLRTLRVTPHMGRSFEPADDRVESEPVAAIGFGFWQTELGGDPGILGQTLEVDEVPHRVIAVMPRGFAFPDADVDLWLSLRSAPRAIDFFYLSLLGRREADTTQRQLAAGLATRRHEIPDGSGAGTMTVELRATPLHESTVGPLRPQLTVFLAAVLAVLMIACLNVTHLILTRAVGRRHELSLRTALGAGRRRLVGQLVVESTLLSVAGGGVGCVLAAAILRGLRWLGPGWAPNPEDLGLDVSAVAFGLLLAVVAGALLGLLPALRASADDPSSGLVHARGQVGYRGQRLRGALIVAQLAAATVLVGSALLLFDSFRALSNREAGFRSEGLLIVEVDLPEGRYGERLAQTAYYDRLLEELRVLPGVDSVGLGSSGPLQFFLGYGLEVEGFVPVSGEQMVTRVRLVRGEYFEAAGAQLLEGRFLEEDDGFDALVINASLRRQFFGEESAVGRRIRLAPGDEEPWRTVVGVVADVQHYARQRGWANVTYVPFDGVDYPFVLTTLVRASADPMALAPAVRQRVAAIDSRVPVGAITRFEDQLWEGKSTPRLRTSLLGAFGGVALLLAAVGLYGVMAFWVAEHRREIGVRLALGAERRRILRQVLSHGLGLVVIGIGIGWLLSWPVSHLLSSQLQDLEPWRLDLQAGAIAILTLAAVVACWYPAHRAARVDPMVVLRED